MTLTINLVTSYDAVQVEVSSHVRGLLELRHRGLVTQGDRHRGIVLAADTRIPVGTYSIR